MCERDWLECARGTVAQENSRDTPEWIFQRTPGMCSSCIDFTFMVPSQSMIQRLFGAVLLFILGGGVLACGSGQNSGTNLEVINPRLVQTPDGQRSFTGTLVNERSQPLSIAQVEVALYDENGSPVETVRIEVKDIPGQDSVEFSGTIDSDRPFQQAQVKSVFTP